MGFDQVTKAMSAYRDEDQQLSAGGTLTVGGWGEEEKPAKKNEKWPVT